MSKRTIVIVAIVGAVSLALAAVVMLAIYFDPMQAGAGGGGFGVGKSSVQYVTIGANQRVGLVICTDAMGTSSSGAESGLFSGSVAKGSIGTANGKRIEWEWNSPRDKGGDFQLDGAPYDLSKGSVFLVSTKGGQVRVEQLDADLSSFPTQRRGNMQTAFKDWAKGEPKVGQFLAEAE